MSEHLDLQVPFALWLRKNNILYWHAEKGKGVNKTHRGGWPDLLVLNDGKVMGIELKSKGKKLNPAQERMKTEFYANSINWYTCFDLETAKSFVCVFVNKNLEF